MGRPKKLSEEQLIAVFTAWKNDVPVKTLAMENNVSVGTIYRALTQPKQLELDLGDKE